MTIYEFKKWVANIPESMEDANIDWVDFSYPEQLGLRISEDSYVTISEGPFDEGPYSDKRNKK